MNSQPLPSADVLTRAAPPPDLVLRYGAGPEQVADVRLPSHGAGKAASAAPLVIFLHGGFWRLAYDRTHTGPLAVALAGVGYAVCVPEFRRAGQPGGGWPGTFEDVAAALDRLPGLVRQAGVEAGSSGRILLAGHSAGGHLALWAAGRHLLAPGSGWHADRQRIQAVVALAAVSDLPDCHRRGLGQGAAAALIGGGPTEFPERYRVADPAALLPLGCTVRLLHGEADDRVPCAMSREYEARARAAGDDTSLEVLPGAGHFDVIDPLSPAWPRVLATFAAVSPPRACDDP